jgi:hypothetical protein
MVQAISIHETGGTPHSNGNATMSNRPEEEEPQTTPYLSTQPAPDANWQVTLSNKVIAITGANRRRLLARPLGARQRRLRRPGEEKPQSPQVPAHGRHGRTLDQEDPGCDR